jgi:hypothetical protein
MKHDLARSASAFWRASSARGLVLAGAGLALSAACAAAPGDNDATALQDDSLRAARWGAFPHRVVAVPRVPTLIQGSGGTGSSSGGQTGSAPPASTPTSDDADAIMAAARTPDGRAIPQAAEPDGSCPPVVVLLGFWACPTLGEVCSYTAAGSAHDCSCSRVDGEGQTPAWVCH